MTLYTALPFSACIDPAAHLAHELLVNQLRLSQQDAEFEWDIPARHVALYANKEETLLLTRTCLCQHQSLANFCMH